MRLDFNSIDVETANADQASICQIGIATVRNGVIADEWSTLIDPDDWFDPWNVSIHGIDEDDVKNSPTFTEISGEIRSLLHASVVVSHMTFDRVAIERSLDRSNQNQLTATWLDSARIARRAWPDKYAKRGYGLANIANDLGISFRHHDALEDAKAAAEIVIQACKSTGLDIQQWLSRVNQPIYPSTRSPGAPRKKPPSISRSGNVNGALFGETILFTGTLEIPRRQAAGIAAEAGCRVIDNMSKKVTILVVGTQDMNRLNGYRKSAKHRKAESLIRQGEDIQIVSESDFFEIMAI